MRTLLASVTLLPALLAATPAWAQCYCNLYGYDGGCADMICTNGFSYDNRAYDRYDPYDPFYSPYYIPPSPYTPASTRSTSSDITVDMTSNRSTAEPGETVTVTLRLRNPRNGTQTADVRAVFDPDFDFVSASGGGDEDGDEVRWDNVRVPSRSSKTLTMRLRVRSNADDGDRLSVRAYTDRASDTLTVRVDDDNNNDDDDDDNDDDDLRVVLSDSPDPVSAGDTLTYRIRIENESNDDLDDIRVRAVLDSDTSFLSASNGGDEDDGDVEWDNIDIDEDEEETLTLRVRVRSGVRNGDTLRLRVEVEGEDDTISTRVGYGSSSTGGTCTYYNSYLGEYYVDYCR